VSKLQAKNGNQGKGKEMVLDQTKNCPSCGLVIFFQEMTVVESNEQPDDFNGAFFLYNSWQAIPGLLKST
jgi:hypothetical protein